MAYFARSKRVLHLVSLGNVISIYRPIRRTITLTQPSADSESRIADKLSFESIFRWKFTYMPRYFKYFESFNPPERPSLPFTEVLDGVRDLTDKNPLRALSRKGRFES